ncbi:hypothetical protein KC328_g16856 [Hortaea werneckii]|nr:hypothetical protein KC328_g16856 [Hortaea werneckii]
MLDRIPLHGAPQETPPLSLDVVARSSSRTALRELEQSPSLDFAWGLETLAAGVGSETGEVAGRGGFGEAGVAGA